MTRTLAVVAALALAAAAPLAQAPVHSAYAIVGARIVPVSAAPIESGTVVIRDGRIAAVGAGLDAPADAERIDGKGLTVYPGLIDMGTRAGLALPAPPEGTPETTEDVERRKRTLLQRADFEAAAYVDPDAAALAKAAAAGITAVLATPAGDAIRGRSALVRTALPPDAPQIGAIADARRPALIVRAPVALHVSFSGDPGGGNAYPNSLMGVIAFVRQQWLDAQHYGAAVDFAAAHPDTAGPAEAPAYAAMQPALDGTLPVAFEANATREIARAMDMARAFELTPVITGAREADKVVDLLKDTRARVVLSLDYPTRSESIAPDADEPVRVLRARADAPKTAGILAKAGVPFVFASGGLEDPADFIKNAAAAVRQGLDHDKALSALTIDAATLAGASAELGSIEVGKEASLLVTEGDIFDEKMAIRHVFVAGHPVVLETVTEEQRSPVDDE